MLRELKRRGMAAPVLAVVMVRLVLGCSPRGLAGDPRAGLLVSQAFQRP